MCGKVILLAVVCVSFVQVRGDEDLKVVIESGLKRLRNLTANAGKELENFADFAHQLDKDYRMISISTRAVWEVLKKEGNTTVQTEAKQTKEKAENSWMPQSVKECVDRFNKQATTDIGEFYTRFFWRLWDVELEMRKDIRMHVAAAQKLGRDFSVKITYAESEIRNSADVTSVERTVAIFELHVKSLRRNIAGINEKLQQDFNDYVEQVENYKGQFKMDLEEMISMARWNIRLCLLSRNAILAILLGLEK